MAVWSNLQHSPSLGGASKCQSGAEAGTGVGAGEYWRSNKSPGPPAWLLILIDYL